jgi:hypothetical protein
MRYHPIPRAAVRSATLTVCAAAAVVALAECNSSTSPNATRTTRGVALPMGNGSVTGYVTVNSHNAPVAVGVQLSAAALTGLPTAGMTTEFVVTLPAEAAPTGVDHIVVNWNPHGHPPMGIYNVPHFDVHLYRITEAQRAAIGPQDPQWAAKVANAPTGDLVPANYVADAAGIPRMGRHWADSTGDQYDGQPFTGTFIYGSYDGDFIFYEPMIALSYLQTKPAFHANIGVAVRQAHPLHPTGYSVTYDASTTTYRIEVDGWKS